MKSINTCRRKHMSKITNTKLWATGAVASAIGLLASTLQSIQVIAHFKNPEVSLICDINSVFNCNSVFDAWQSSVFGFSNSLICMIFFAITFGVMITGAMGSQIHRNLRLLFHFFAVFFLGFGAWYLWSSAAIIRALCIYCIFCYAAVIVLNFAWLRININDLPFNSKLSKVLQNAVNRNNDSIFWLLWASVIAGIFVYYFA